MAKKNCTEVRFAEKSKATAGEKIGERQIQIHKGAWEVSFDRVRHRHFRMDIFRCILLSV